MTLKEIRERAEEMKSVGNVEELRETVPFLVEAYKRLRDFTNTIKTVKKELDRLSDKASKYAIAHPTCFDAEKLDVSPIGVRSGDLTINGNVYHFASGYGAIVREDGELLTQDFLITLPSDWLKAELKLSPTAIMEKYGKGEKYGEALQTKGLVRSVKNTWGEKVLAASADDYSD